MASAMLLVRRAPSLLHVRAPRLTRAFFGTPSMWEGGDGGEGEAAVESVSAKPQKKKWSPKDDPWADLYDDAYYWMDLTGLGVDHNLEKNGMLSEDAKQTMYFLHKESPAEWSHEKLAEKYKIRQQRVIAIITLQELKAGRKSRGLYDEELGKLYDGAVDGGTYEKGTGERHRLLLPSMPNFELVDELEEEDGDLLLNTSARVAEEQERAMVAEFTKRTAYNAGLVGEGLIRTGARLSAPKRPDQGFSLMVKPLGARGGEPFVAEPDGTHRPPSTDEALWIEQKKVLPRRKLV